jgi:hypothetical protein
MFGNKGEWSEIYTLLKLLGDKKLFAGDVNLEKVESLFYPIIKIIRNETNSTFEYEYDGDLVLITGDGTELRISIEEFKKQAEILFEKIKTEKGVFEVPEMESFVNLINCKTLKSKSSSKTDIRIVIYDLNISKTADLGFSIKSQIGGDATLLNAGKTTNFIYEILDCDLSDDEMNEINAIESRSKIKDRIESIKIKGGVLKFSHLEQAIFKNNLVLIDSFLPNILASILNTFFTSSLSSVADLTKFINEKNTLEYDQNFAHNFYEYKMKRFLTDVALGMTPSKVWNGEYEATGGYLIVKEDGEVLCYHIYNKNQFEDYLFNNTKLETASSTRHEFGKIYKVDNKIFFKLNLQVRFK